MDLYSFSNDGITMAHYFRALYPYTVMARWAGRCRHVAFQSRRNCWRHVHRFDASRSDALRGVFMDALGGGDDRWTSLHLGELYQPAVRGTSSLPSPVQVVRTEHELAMDMDLNGWDSAAKRPAQLRHGVLCRCGLDQPDRCCADCWALVELADVVVRTIYCDELGLGEPLWVFSGGKGAHCWFANARARTLTPPQRQELFRTLASWHHPGRIAELAHDTRNPLLARLTKAFELLVVAGRRQLFARPEAWAWLQRRASYAMNGGAVGGDSTERWQAFKRAATVHSVAEVVLEFALPLFDVQASGDRHLIKAPFSIHSKTQRVSMPVRPERLHEFDPAGACAVGDSRLPAQLADAVLHVTAWLDQAGFPALTPSLPPPNHTVAS